MLRVRATAGRVGRRAWASVTGALLLDAALLAVFALVFVTFAFRPRYAPDFLVQVEYLHYRANEDVGIASSIANNAWLLDYVVYGAQRALGLGAEDALRACYWAAFVAKYAVIVKTFRSRAIAALLFMWGFFSFDVNQLRMNVALLLLVLAFAGVARPVTIAAAGLVHLGSLATLPALATAWRWSRGGISAVVIVAIAAFAVAVTRGVALDDRLLFYLQREALWVPRTLLACPVMMLVVFGELDRPSAAVLGITALVPIALAMLGMGIFAARWAELAFAALLVKLGTEGRPAARWRLALLAVPAALMFGSRALFGINPAG